LNNIDHGEKPDLVFLIVQATNMVFLKDAGLGFMGSSSFLFLDSVYDNLS